MLVDMTQAAPESGVPVLLDAVDVAGTTLCSVELDSTASVASVKASIETHGGPPAKKQQVVIDGKPVFDSTQTLADLLPQLRANDAATTNAALPITVLVVALPADENLALVSKGARLDADEEEDRRLLKPLLQHDVAFPQLCGKEWWDDEDPQAAVIDTTRRGDALGRHLASVGGAGWGGDVQQSFFMSNEEEVTLHFPGGVKLRKVGFTYSPWDRNYGRSCELFVVRAHGNEEVYAGTMDIDAAGIRDHGDPSRHDVRTIMFDFNELMQDEVCRAVRFKIDEGCGRRLFFLFAIGCKVSDDS
eukprot:TRINITY_DN26723_c0_g1_i1.p1 TRINITY_DN26723_c0_g1~~TRINITY_DN26723_c0_g1_i1.p1  ORF type:complete len:303 (-),score=47.66 TRINITY_DN26723_c0_g1_i1:15-923(-)